MSSGLDPVYMNWVHERGQSGTKKSNILSQSLWKKMSLKTLKINSEWEMEERDKIRNLNDRTG